MIQEMEFNSKLASNLKILIQFWILSTLLGLLVFLKQMKYHECLNVSQYCFLLNNSISEVQVCGCYR